MVYACKQVYAISHQPNRRITCAEISKSKNSKKLFNTPNGVFKRKRCICLSRVGYSVGIDGVDGGFIWMLAYKKKHADSTSKT